jgi:hypothetical protein
LIFQRLRLLLEKTSKGGKKESLMSLICIKLLGFLLIPRTMTMPKHGHIRIRFIDTLFFNTLSNKLFDVYCSYKKAKEIWSNIVTKYTVEDVRKQKSSIGKFYQWEMVKNKDIKTQINEYHRLLEDIKAKNINLREGFIAGILIKKKLPN